MPRAGVARYAFFPMKKILILMLLLAGCSKMPTLQPHKIDIQQGNYVTQDIGCQAEAGHDAQPGPFRAGHAADR